MPSEEVEEELEDEESELDSDDDEGEECADQRREIGAAFERRDRPFENGRKEQIVEAFDDPGDGPQRDCDRREGQEAGYEVATQRFAKGVQDAHEHRVPPELESAGHGSHIGWRNSSIGPGARCANPGESENRGRSQAALEQRSVVTVGRVGGDLAVEAKDFEGGAAVAPV